MPEKKNPPSVVLITGAGKGIGRAVAETLAARARAAALPGAPRPEAAGVELMLTARTAADLEALKSRIEGAGVVCDLVVCDLADQPLRPVEACLARFGRIDALVHCAGVGRFKDFLEQTPEDLEFTLKTNVTATFLLLQRGYAAMKAQTPRDGMRGQIQVVTSIAAEQPFAQSSTYCLSKHAQRGLLDVMRLYGRQDGIRILEVRPGAAYTPMWGEVDPAQVARMMSAEDVAQPMVDALALSARAALEVLTLRPLHGDL